VIVHESDRVIVLEPTQDLYEGGECDQMEETLARLAVRGSLVVVDVTHVHHITARCLGILAHARQVASRNGGCIVLCGATRAQRWLLEKTGFADVLAVHGDMASAKRHLATFRRAVA
jgi:anti-anti-sigma factor